MEGVLGVVGTEEGCSLGEQRSRESWLFSVCEHMEFIIEGVLLTLWGRLGLLPSSHPAVVATARGEEWKPQTSLICHAKQILAVSLNKIPVPSAQSTP